MRLLQNSSGNHLGMTPEEALELITKLSKAISDAYKAPTGSSGGFVDAMLIHRSVNVAGGDNRDYPSTIHVFVERGYAQNPHCEVPAVKAPVKLTPRKLRAQVKKLLEMNQKIEGIKLVRMTNYLGLKEALDLVNKWQAKWGL